MLSSLYQQQEAGMRPELHESIWGLFVEINQFKPELTQIAFI